MYMDEQIVLRMARERVEEAVRAAEQRRALRTGQARRSTRVRLGSALVRLGHRMLGQSSPAPSTPSPCPE
jgi:hypothetical protein